jgi:hypothetical protein
VVSKALEVAVVLLYVGLVVTTLYAGVLPDYRGAAGDATAERVLTAVANGVRDAVPPPGTRATVTLEVPVPDAIQGAGYRVVLDGGRLVLSHPREGVGGRRDLALADRVSATGGAWDGGELVVRATSDGTTVAVELGEARS